MREECGGRKRNGAHPLSPFPNRKTCTSKGEDLKLRYASSIRFPIQDRIRACLPDRGRERLQHDESGNLRSKDPLQGREAI